MSVIRLVAGAVRVVCDVCQKVSDAKCTAKEARESVRESGWRTPLWWDKGQSVTADVCDNDAPSFIQFLHSSGAEVEETV